MDWSWRKYGIWIGLVLIILLMPFFLISSTMMEIYLERVNENPKTEFNNWLLLKSANICFHTLRPEMAAERYRRYLELYPDDENRRLALFYFASSLEDSEKTADALAVYLQFTEEYPSGVDTTAAWGAVDRLRYMKPR
ncbi:MAG TPA: tetratricopeptide repeat protein [Planctomycetota bacterium]